MDGIRAPQGAGSPYPRIQRRFTDTAGKTWYVVRPEAPKGEYPPGGRPVAFEEALEKRVRTQALPESAPPPPPIVGPSAEDLKELVYRAVLRGLPGNGPAAEPGPEAAHARAAYGRHPGRRVSSGATRP